MQSNSLHWTFWTALNFSPLCCASFYCTLQSALLYIVVDLNCLAPCNAILALLQRGCEFWRPSAYSKDWRWELGSLKGKIQVGTTFPWKLKWELDARRPRLKTKSPKIGQRHPGRFPGSFNLWPLSTIPTTLIDVLYTFLGFSKSNWLQIGSFRFGLLMSLHTIYSIYLFEQ